MALVKADFLSNLQEGDKTYYDSFDSFSSAKVVTGFKPKKLIVATSNYNGVSTFFCIYDENTSTTQFNMVYNKSIVPCNIGDYNYGGFLSIDDDGFTMTGYYSYWKSRIYVLAIG